MNSSRKKFILYIIVGIWNTVFGYALYACFTYFLDAYSLKFSYVFAYIISNIFSITQAFVMHKYIVFKSHGSFWNEYKKCWIVYGSTTLLSLALLPLFVYIFSVFLPMEVRYFDKYIGGIAATLVVAIISFVGHQNVTFKQ